MAADGRPLTPTGHLCFASPDLFQVLKLDGKQEAAVKAEMEKLRNEQAAFKARKGKGPAVRPSSPSLRHSCLC